MDPVDRKPRWRRELRPKFAHTRDLVEGSKTADNWFFVVWLGRSLGIQYIGPRRRR
jgi:hypothetical protein